MNHLLATICFFLFALSSNQGFSADTTAVSLGSGDNCQKLCEQALGAFGDPKKNPKCANYSPPYEIDRILEKSDVDDQVLVGIKDSKNPFAGPKATPASASPAKAYTLTECDRAYLSVMEHSCSCDCATSTEKFNQAFSEAKNSCGRLGTFKDLQTCKEEIQGCSDNPETAGTDKDRDDPELIDDPEDLQQKRKEGYLCKLEDPKDPKSGYNCRMPSSCEKRLAVCSREDLIKNAKDDLKSMKDSAEKMDDRIKDLETITTKLAETEELYNSQIEAQNVAFSQKTSDIETQANAQSAAKMEEMRRNRIAATDLIRLQSVANNDYNKAVNELYRTCYQKSLELINTMEQEMRRLNREGHLTVRSQQQALSGATGISGTKEDYFKQNLKFCVTNDLYLSRLAELKDQRADALQQIRNKNENLNSDYTRMDTDLKNMDKKSRDDLARLNYLKQAEFNKNQRTHDNRKRSLEQQAALLRAQIDRDKQQQSSDQSLYSMNAETADQLEIAKSAKSTLDKKACEKLESVIKEITESDLALRTACHSCQVVANQPKECSALGIKGYGTKPGTR